jgi:peptidoglycan/xylan/chitin deacetylase (PgdA/CDA1 family)
MFHHFHSESHAPKPGSIDAEGFRRLVHHLQESFNLLPAEVFLDRALSKSLEPDDVVLTFDDALKSQVDVALPVLDELSLTAVFNVYSSVFSGEPDPLEIYADFRAIAFDSFSEFWQDFRATSSAQFPGKTARLGSEYPPDYLSTFSFYSVEERQFRFLRDALLGPSSYRVVMDEMIARSAYDVGSRIGLLWMNKAELSRIAGGGHTVGLHSHTHPTRMSALSRETQKREYVSNFEWIVSELGETPTVVAHPCGDYSKETLDILESLGISVGFRSSLTPGRYHSTLEIPRQDHAVLAKELALL